MKLFIFAGLALAVLISTPAARAHYLWIESDTNAEARVYYGEFNEGLRETAGGRLDERGTLQGWVRTAESRRALELEKKPDHFAATLKAADGWVLVEDLDGGVKDWSMHDIGIVKPMYYARAAIGNRQTGTAKPAMALDIVPAADEYGPQSLRVFFKSKPLPKAKLNVHAPNHWSRELKADEHGVLTIETPWTGRYVLEVIYKERTPGTYRDEPYQAIRHRATYSFVR